MVKDENGNLKDITDTITKDLDGKYEIPVGAKAVSYTHLLLDFIAEHYAEPLTLDALAEQVNEKAGHVIYCLLDTARCG